MARLHKRGLFTEGQVSCTVFTVVSCTSLLCNLASVSSAVVFEYILNEDTLMHVAAPVRVGLLVHPVNAYSCRALLLLTRLTGKHFQRKQRLVRKSQVGMPIYRYCILTDLCLKLSTNSTIVLLDT